MNKRQRKRHEKEAKKKRAESSFAVVPAKREIGEYERNVEPPDSRKDESHNERQRPMTFKEWLNHIPNLTIAIFTVILAVIAGIQACLSQKQSRIMRVDQRPWIKADAQMGPVAANAPFAGMMRIVNSGKTPAKSTTVKVAIEKVSSKHEPTLQYEGGREIITDVLFPNVPNDIQVLHGTTVDPKTKREFPDLLSETDVADYNAGRVYFAIFSDITYTDFYKVEHRTHYCRWFGVDNPPGEASQSQVVVPFAPNDTTTQSHEVLTFHAKRCVQYNDVDNN